MDAISRVSGDLIRRMKNLKMIHSEGVAFDGIDVEAAWKQGIYVCNNKGANADAVAEQAIFLMLALLRSGIAGDAAVRSGRQIEMKEQRMREGITDLGDCQVGLVGLGDIGLATARRLSAFGCRLCYYKPPQESPGAGSSVRSYLSPPLPAGRRLRYCQPSRGRDAGQPRHDR